MTNSKYKLAAIAQGSYVVQDQSGKRLGVVSNGSLWPKPQRKSGWWMNGLEMTHVIHKQGAELDDMIEKALCGGH
jgi:hypothetical protein